MQFHFCCVVLALAVSSSTAMPGQCTVGEISNGEIRERTLGASEWSWVSFQYVRPVIHKKVSPGTVTSSNALFLICNEGYLVHGTELKEVQIHCSHDKWTPEALCHLKSEFRCSAIDEKGIFTVLYNNDRKVNSVANYACKEQGRKISGSNIRICQENTKWSGVDPECVEIVCPAIDEKGIFTILYSNNKRINSVAYYICKEQGRKISGFNARTCQENGEWSRVDPECVESEVLCPAIDEKDIFTVLYGNNRKVNSIAYYACKEQGKKISGFNVRTCQENGEWSDVDPECVESEIRCPAIDERDIFIVLYSNARKINSAAYYACKEHGRKISGSRVRICQENGEWSCVDPECVESEVRCPVINEKGSFTVVYSNDRRVNSVAYYVCKEQGGKISGSNFRTCQDNGEWSSVDPECMGTEIRCPLVDSKGIFRLIFSGDRKINGTVSYSCVEGTHKLHGQGMRICQKNGEWSGSEPQCLPKATEIRCPLVDSKGIFRLIFSSDRKINGTVSYTCVERTHKLHGQGIRICQKNGEWSGSEPQCLPKATKIRCPLIDGKGIFRLIFSGDRKINGTVSYSCVEGTHKLHGQGTRICEKNGEWSGSEPQCLPKEPVIRCPPIDNEDVFIVDYTNDRKINSTVFYSCKRKGYTLSGRRIRTCQQNGEWTGVDPECLGEDLNGCAFDVGNLSPNLEIEPTKEEYHFGDFVGFSCKYGFKLTPHLEQMMCLGSGWSDEVPDCKKKELV